MRRHRHIAFVLATHFLIVLLHWITSVHGIQPSAGRTAWVVMYGAKDGSAEVETAASQVSRHTMLSSVIPSDEVSDHIIYNYTKSFNGFAAWLTSEEAARINSSFAEIASIFQCRMLTLHTTRSWTLLGLSLQSPESILSQRKLLIGVMDTGVWQTSESLRDFETLAEPQFYDAPPGYYDKKVPIDEARSSQLSGLLASYPSTYLSMDGVVDDTNYFSTNDSNGHGTHIATTAAGNSVPGTSFSSLAEGTAQGGVPGARLASYKVCWGEGRCGEADVLAAFDHAISAGVDVISVSFGGPAVANLFADAIALGSFYAIKNGIVVVCSTGNNGPDLGEATNVAPWVITVAAGNIDRQFYTTVVLGNNISLQGRSINTEAPKGYYPLIQGSKAGFNLSSLSSNCSHGSLDPEKVKGKLVVCESGTHPEQSSSVFAAGGIGMIIIDTSTTEIGAFTFGVPTSVIGSADGETLLAYLHSSSSPIAQILPTNDPLDEPSPLLADFSSRGPSRVNYQVFKPDVIAPGVSILAAWSGVHSITNEPQDQRMVSYNIVTGTSIACPHVSGAAAYVKDFHPDWSPAAIKSALMTTAMPLDKGHASNVDGEFGYGSGLIQPHVAINPGLIYDIEWQEYIEWLCGQGYEPTKMRLITGIESTCTKKVKRDLNYAAITLPVEGGSEEMSDRWWSFTRTVTNVGVANSTYKALVEVPMGMKVVVNPPKISFSKLKEKKTFVIKVQVPGLKTSISPNIGDHLSASLVWSDGVFLVRSPIVAWIAPNALQIWPRSTTTPSIGFRV